MITILFVFTLQEMSFDDEGQSIAVVYRTCLFFPILTLNLEKHVITPNHKRVWEWRKLEMSDKEQQQWQQKMFHSSNSQLYGHPKDRNYNSLAILQVNKMSRSCHL